MMRVLLADPSPAVRDGLRTIINSEAALEVVGEVSGGRAALAAIARVRPDVAVVAVDLDGMDGIEVTRRIAGSPAIGDPPVPVLVIGGDSLDTVVAAVRAGARGYLRRRVISDGLVAAVRALGSGGGHLGPAVTRQLLEYAAPLLPLPDPNAHPWLGELSDREREVLRLLGRGHTNAQIAAELVVTEATVKSHVSSLLLKLGLRNRLQAALLAHRTGLVGPDLPATDDAPNGERPFDQG